ncbi:MAG: hypothetical protein F9K40_22125 [Kofleriaceae bacterium]|nr:MAG: hypothetical protein F9K40_22125 [Kofleriaceae bacterium]MBZ0234549.1 hypothetical protein [Kofleriaceae bacterium]
MRNVLVLYAAPIPVGHRVELRWYTQVSSGLFGGSKETARELEPVIVDLDTGIEFASDHAYTGGGVKRPDEPVEISPVVTGEPSSVLRGTVRACRVIHVRRFSELDVQTYLSIEPER